MQGIVKIQSSIYFDMLTLFFTINKVLLYLARDSILCTFSQMYFTALTLTLFRGRGCKFAHPYLDKTTIKILGRLQRPKFFC